MFLSQTSQISQTLVCCLFSRSYTHDIIAAVHPPFYPHLIYSLLVPVKTLVFEEITLMTLLRSTQELQPGFCPVLGDLHWDGVIFVPSQPCGRTAGRMCCLLFLEGFLLPFVRKYNS